MNVSVPLPEPKQRGWVKINIPKAAHARLSRISKLADRSMSELVETLLRHWEAGIVSKLTDEQRSQYMAKALPRDAYQAALDQERQAPSIAP
jgi:hypothetical protein